MSESSETRRERWIEASARNMADWHGSSVRALGVQSSRTNALWSREPMPPSIYLGAIPLASARAEPGIVGELAEQVACDPDAPIALWDTFNELDLSALGFRQMPWVGEWWMKDAATQPEKPDVPDLQIERVQDEATLRAFGVATLEGFESAEVIRAAGPLGMHHPGTLGDPRMHYFVGRVQDRVVTSSIAYVGDDVVGIYGVSTLPAFRRRGYGKAITWAAAMVAPELDVAVSPDEMARGVESALGFRKIAEYTPWSREPGLAASPGARPARGRR